MTAKDTNIIEQLKDISAWRYAIFKAPSSFENIKKQFGSKIQRSFCIKLYKAYLTKADLKKAIDYNNEMQKIQLTELKGYFASIIYFFKKIYIWSKVRAAQKYLDKAQRNHEAAAKNLALEKLQQNEGTKHIADEIAALTSFWGYKKLRESLTKENNEPDHFYTKELLIRYATYKVIENSKVASDIDKTTSEKSNFLSADDFLEQEKQNYINDEYNQRMAVNKCAQVIIGKLNDEIKSKDKELLQLNAKKAEIANANLKSSFFTGPFHYTKIKLSQFKYSILLWLKSPNTLNISPPKDEEECISKINDTLEGKQLLQTKVRTIMLKRPLDISSCGIEELKELKDAIDAAKDHLNIDLLTKNTDLLTELEEQSYNNITLTELEELISNKGKEGVDEIFYEQPTTYEAFLNKLENTDGNQDRTQNTLNNAIDKNNVELVKKLIHKNPNIINNKNTADITALHIAAMSSANNKAIGNKEKSTLEALLSNQDVNVKDECDNTPLHLAIMQNNVHSAERLLNNGSDINAQNNHGKTPLHIAIYKANSLILESKVKEDKESIGSSKEPSLDHEIIKLLLEKGADVNRKDKFEYTPLHLAIINNNKEIVELLLKQGADRKIKDHDGSTSLDLAAINNRTEILELIFEKDKSNTEKITSEEIFTTLESASQYGNENIVNLLLEKIKDMEYKKKIAKEILTILKSASQYGNKNTIKLIFTKSKEMGVEITAKEILTTLESAINSVNADIVNLIFEKSKEMKAEITAKEILTLLKSAVEYNNPHMVDALFKKVREREQEIKVEEILTLLNIAVEYDNTYTIKLLEEITEKEILTLSQSASKCNNLNMVDALLKKAEDMKEILDLLKLLIKKDIELLLVKTGIKIEIDQPGAQKLAAKKIKLEIDGMLNKYLSAEEGQSTSSTFTIRS